MENGERNIEKKAASRRPESGIIYLFTQRQLTLWVIYLITCICHRIAKALFKTDHASSRLHRYYFSI